MCSNTVLSLPFRPPLLDEEAGEAGDTDGASAASLSAA